jgi:hypothetical protein
MPPVFAIFDFINGIKSVNGFLSFKILGFLFVYHYDILIENQSRMVDLSATGQRCYWECFSLIQGNRPDINLPFSSPQFFIYDIRTAT